MKDTETILEFGTKRENEERRDGGCAVVFDPESQKYAVYENLKNGLLGFYGGGIESGEDDVIGTLRELTEESGLINFSHVEKVDKVYVHYFNSNKNVNRFAYAICILVILQNTDCIETKLEEHEKFKLIWVTKEELLISFNDRNKNKDVDHWIYFLEKAKTRIKELGYDTTSKI